MKSHASIVMNSIHFYIVIIFLFVTTCADPYEYQCEIQVDQLPLNEFSKDFLVPNAAKAFYVNDQNEYLEFNLTTIRNDSIQSFYDVCKGEIARFPTERIKQTWSSSETIVLNLEIRKLLNVPNHSREDPFVHGFDVIDISLLQESTYYENTYTIYRDYLDIISTRDLDRLEQEFHWNETSIPFLTYTFKGNEYSDVIEFYCFTCSFNPQGQTLYAIVALNHGLLMFRDESGEEWYLDHYE